jgi:hypothetical protein
MLLANRTFLPAYRPWVMMATRPTLRNFILSCCLVGLWLVGEDFDVVDRGPKKFLCKIWGLWVWQIGASELHVRHHVIPIATFCGSNDVFCDWPGGAVCSSKGCFPLSSESLPSPASMLGALYEAVSGTYHHGHKLSRCLLRHTSSQRSPTPYSLSLSACRLP